MTPESFKQKIKKPDKVDNILNYCLCVFLIAAGVYLSYGIYIDGWPPFSGLGKYSIIVVPLLPFSAGIYGLWRIDENYSVKQVSSFKSIDDKQNAIDVYLNQFTIIRKRVEGRWITVRYRNKYYTSIDIKFYLDEDKVLFNAQGADLSKSKGIMDFGIGRRVMKRIERHLEACL